MNGYTLLMYGVVWEWAAYETPEPYKSQFAKRAMDFYHESAKDEHERRMRGDKPDHRHLTYL
jgi:hypothetical protein